MAKAKKAEAPAPAAADAGKPHSTLHVLSFICIAATIFYHVFLRA